jgi:hypothetical protein
MDSEDTQTTETPKQETASVSSSSKKTIGKAQAKEHNKKVKVAKKKYFVPTTGKTYEAESLQEASALAAKELKRSRK